MRLAWGGLTGSAAQAQDTHPEKNLRAYECIQT